MEASIKGGMEMQVIPEYMLCSEMDGWSKMQLAFCSFSVPLLVIRYGHKVLAFL